MKSLFDSLWGSIASTLSLFRLKAFDTSSADGRSRERMRRVLLTSASAIISRVISISGPLITVPMALGYLGPERYGLWMTVNGIMAMFAFADFGIGNGLMTEISQAEGRGDVQASHRSITSALIALSTIALAFLILFGIAYPFVSWSSFFNAKSADLIRESGPVMAVCFISFLANLPLGVVQRAQWGLQEGFYSHLWQCIASLINLSVVWLAVKAHAGLPILVLCVAGVPLLMNILNGTVFFGFQRPNLRPAFRFFHMPTAKKLVRTGSWFFLLSILTAVGIYSDTFVVAHVLGLSVVPLYSVPAGLASYLTTVATMLYTPLWAANGEAISRGDIQWVRDNTVRIVKLNLAITGTAAVAFVILGPIFLHRWIGPDFTPGRWLLAGMASWALLTSSIGPVFMILNGANVVRIQVIIFSLFTPVAIFLKVLFAKHLGVYGVVWASVIPYALMVVPTIVMTAGRVLRQAEQSAATQAAGSSELQSAAS